MRPDICDHICNVAVTPLVPIFELQNELPVKKCLPQNGSAASLFIGILQLYGYFAAFKELSAAIVKADDEPIVL